MTLQDNQFNLRVLLGASIAVVLGLLIAWYYSYANSQAQIAYLEDERSLLVKDLTLMQAEVNRLSALNEVNEIELQDSRYRVQQLLDSVGRLNFTVGKLREDKRRLRILESRFDSLKTRNDYLHYNNMLLGEKYDETRKMIEELRGRSSDLAAAEALLREKNRELDRELRTKQYMALQNPEGNGFRLRNDRPIRTNKASAIEKLRGCVTVLAGSTKGAREKVLYLQFLGPNMQVIEDNSNTVSVSGNVYSKRVELIYTGEEIMICDFITVPEGSLIPGLYTLNIFEDEKLLNSAEFTLK